MPTSEALTQIFCGSVPQFLGSKTHISKKSDSSFISRCGSRKFGLRKGLKCAQDVRCSCRQMGKIEFAKDGEFVRVLRSGRRLRVESSTEVKHRGSKNAEEWFPLIKEENDGEKFEQQRINDWGHDVGAIVEPMDVDDEAKLVPEISNRVVISRDESSRSEIKMFRNVYSRKRKRNNVGNSVISDSKKYGLQFVRRKRRKGGGSSCEKKGGGDDYEGCNDHGLLSVSVESSCAGCSLFSSVLSSLLSYIGKGRTGLAEISALVISSPISTVFASSGIHILWNCPSIKRKGLCRIFGVRHFVSMFTVDYMAAPMCFSDIHAAYMFRSVCISSPRWIDYDENNGSTDETLTYVNDQSESSLSKVVAPASDEPLTYNNDQSESSLSKLVAPTSDVCKDVNVKSVNLSSLAGKLCTRNVQRIGVLTRSASKRRRRSLRSRRARNPLQFALQKSTAPPVSNGHIIKKNVLALPLVSKQELRRSARKSSTSEINVQNSNSMGLNVDIDSQCCVANILVVETDKCYRVEGAEVMLDVSSSKEWLLVVKTDGSTRYTFKVQREMRPGTTNRYTHAVIWAGENGWKLEFSERKDWAVFKELYKVCGERNIVPTSPVAKIIPVPGVCEVEYAWDSPIVFKRPESYIRTTSDELSRTVARRTANYDMDSEDESWLSKFNSESNASDHISDDSFELMVDAFEKASYYKPEDVNDEKAAASLCLDVASMEVAEAVYRYWMKKRKQKRAPLNRVFQLNQPTRVQLITKPVLRKKRSLKRPTVQPMQRGRGKDSNILQVIAAEHNAAEEQSATLRVEEAKASADKSVEVAILKRQRAQLLMENADLAMYRAAMALRIADAAAESSDIQQAADHFLD